MAAPARSSVKFTTRYALLGLAFGALFPLCATLIDAAVRGSGFGLDALVATHTSSVLHYLIDTVPVFLALFAAAAGWRQDTLGRTLDALRQASDDLQRTNETLAHRNRELVEASELKSHFLANTSHEFRTPLNSIIGFSRLMLRKTADVLPERQLNNLRMIHESGQSLLEMVDRLLEIERADAGEASFRLAPTEVVGIARSVVAEFLPRATDKSLELKLVTDLERARVATDPPRLRQILANFVGNAIKYSDHGVISLNVVKRAGPDGSRIELHVDDQGIGISDDELPAIFDRFYQVDGSITRSQGGVGLGLHVVEKLAKVLEADVSVESEVGVGSSFGISMPEVVDGDGAVDPEPHLA